MDVVVGPSIQSRGSPCARKAPMGQPPSVPPEQPYLLDGGEEKRCREAKENEAIDRLDRAKQPPAVLEMDIGMTEASDRFERIEHRWRPGGQSAKP